MQPDDLYKRLVQRGTEWAEAEHAASLMEGNLKSVKATIALKYKAEGCSVAESDLKAEADHEYIEYRTLAIDARRDAHAARVVYKSAETYVEIWRTIQASERAANRVAV